jgi:hypothetical protein
MLPFPEMVATSELLAVDSRRIFPVPPLRPVLSKVGRVPQHVSAERFVLESVLSIAEPERVIVVF